MMELPREPWRGGQVCGEQIAYGMPYSRFCGELKEPGRVQCQEHYEAWYQGGSPRIAPGNAVGDREQPTVLMWENLDGGDPIPATREEWKAWVMSALPGS